ISNPSICKSQISMRDYSLDEAKVVMQELIEDVARRVRARKKVVRTLHFAFGYSDDSGVDKQYTWKDRTNLAKDLYKVVVHFADQLCN
ncbi:DinB/UmuC family translesion DNA polymerase, partial [Staphylococcus aureus]